MKNTLLSPFNILIYLLLLSSLSLAIAKNGLQLASEPAVIEANELEEPPIMEAVSKTTPNNDLDTELPQTPTTLLEPTISITHLSDKPVLDKTLEINTEKSLDLSLPFKAPDDALLTPENKAALASKKTNIFAPDTHNKPEPIRVDGNILMTQELEAEKRKTLDGAGITIKLKP